MNFLTELLENSSFPFFTAAILGLMTAISPCPLATNITAVGYISRDISSRHKVFLNGIIYTLGRALSYTALAVILYFGADQFSISGLFQQYGERIIGPLLIIIGLFMFGILKVNIPGLGLSNKEKQGNGQKSYWDVLLLGILFALAFCPYSGVLYFGMLIPMTITHPSGLYLPVIFALATGIPVIIFAWFLAYSVSGIGSAYKNVKVFEQWFRKIISILFILVGMYYILTVWFGIMN
ncbi:aromatic aminobenezylarsenical efflux permease ArsG family transporter [Bacteroidota bacterium]